jgi:exonuclease SbcC
MAEQGRAEQRVSVVSAQLEHRRRLEAQIKDDRARAQVLEVLARELRADHFIEFVIQETLDLLAARASDELRRISDGRYSLVSADGQFSVVDHLNADEQRSVKTLSGGETFMASLALALALSQHVSDLAGEGLGAHLEAVFIDEGFGALDPETLEEVIDGLERLRDAELVVGVISHVPEVAARIADGLEVRPDGSRSVIIDRKAA